MSAQLNYVPQWYYYFGGLADKVQGSVIPLDKKGYFNFTRYEPLGVVCRHHAVELAADAHRLEAGSGAGRGQYGGDQAFGVHFGIRARIRQAGGAGRLSPAGRGQRRGPATARRWACRWSSTRSPRKSHSAGRMRTGRVIAETAARGFKKVGLELGGSRRTSFSRTRRWTMR